MREILTQERKEKKSTRNKIIIGIILVVIMAFSTLAYAFFSNPQTENRVKYNGITFSLGENRLWNFKTKIGSFATQYNPLETKNITVPVTLTINNYAGRPLYILSNGEAAQTEILGNLNGVYLKWQAGCIQGYEAECDENAPVKNCSLDNVIILREANSTSITQEGSCVFISSPVEESGLAGDAFIFKILGI